MYVLFRDPVFAPGEQDTVLSQTQQNIGAYSVAEFKQKMQSNSVILIDVRTPEEVAEGYIENALFIDFNNQGFFASEIEKLDRNGEYLLYCRSGNRSGQALQKMKALGFTNVHDLEGGLPAWISAGEKIVTE